MKIGFDYIATIGKGGNSVYSDNLIDSVLSQDRVNKYYLYSFVHDYFLFRLNKYKYQNVYFRPVYFSSLGLPIPQKIIGALNKISFKFWNMFDRLDIFHFTNPINYTKGARNTAVTIHDLSPLYNDEWSKVKSADLFRQKTEAMLNSSKIIIAVSDYTKQDILKNFPSLDVGIDVIYEGASPNYFPDCDTKYVKDKFNIDKYFLYVGQLQPRKNIINIILAYSKLTDEVRQVYPLVLVGGYRDSSYKNYVEKVINDHGVINNIRILGRLEDFEVRKLYSCAKVFLFPSFFEGFGLPILESLKCGTPVITSKTTSMPEVVGRAGSLVSPDSVDEIYENMKRYIEDNDFYNQLRDRCLDQSNKFSWELAGRETVKCYNNFTF